MPTRRRARGPASSARPTILVVAPHPDDETLGCGGTIRRYLIAGYRVICVFLSRGERGGANATVRAKETLDALRSLGVRARDVHFGRFRDCHVTDSVETVTFLEQFAGPEVVAAFVPPVDDCHRDHRHTGLACLAALRRVPSILFYKTPSAISFMPNFFVDITDHLDAKWTALRCHRSQIVQQKTFMEYDALIRESAAMGLQVGVKHAESFQSIRYRLDPCPVHRLSELVPIRGIAVRARPRTLRPTVRKHDPGRKQ